VGQHAAREQIVHQPGLDLPVFGDQGFGAFDGVVDAGEDGGDFLLRINGQRNTDTDVRNFLGIQVQDGRACGERHHLTPNARQHQRVIEKCLVAFLWKRLDAYAVH